MGESDLVSRIVAASASGRHSSINDNDGDIRARLCRVRIPGGMGSGGWCLYDTVLCEYIYSVRELAAWSVRAGGEVLGGREAGELWGRVMSGWNGSDRYIRIK